MSVEIAEQFYVARLYVPGNQDDYDAYMKLENDCVQGTGFVFSFAGEKPRFDKYGPGAIVLMAETKTSGKIVGTIGANIRSVQFQPGEFQLVAWVFSLRVAHDHRRNGLGFLLIKEIERIVTEKGVIFAYCGIGLDNYPSIKLFERCGYKKTWASPFWNINIPSSYRIVPPADKPTPGIVTRKLDHEQSAKFIRRIFSSSFFFPQWERNPTVGNVYLAEKTGSNDFYGFFVNENVGSFTFLSLPFRHRVRLFISKILNYLFPRWFERPLPIGVRWRCRNALPLVCQCSNPANVAPLAKAATELAIRSCYDSTDLLSIASDPAVARIDEQSHQIAAKSTYDSPLYRGSNFGLFCKSLKSNSEEATAMEQYAMQQKFWFLDSNDL